MMLAIVLTCALIYLAGQSEGADWTYDKHHGPHEWPGVCGTGRFQSPIDLSKSVAHPRYFEPLVFFQYNSSASVTLKNNGHTLMLTVQPPCNAEMAGGGLLTPYTLAQVHFHWGSEHTVDGKRYPLEAHFVHFDARRFKGVKEAVGQEDGLAVLGVLYEESSQSNPSLENLFNTAKKVITEGSFSNLQSNIRLRQLLPDNTDTFYRYRGSLTTPDCNEGVLWTVLTSHSTISKDQVAILEELDTVHGKMDLNYRPVQPLNERSLFIRAESSASILKNSFQVMLTVFLLRLFM